MRKALKTIILFTTLLGFLWVAGYGAFSISVLSKKPENTGVSSDIIIVLTGGNYRIKTGFDLWAKGYAPELFITGVHKSVTLPALINQWQKVNADGLLLPECCAAIGHDATTTIENAKETAAWIAHKKISSIHLVTSTYHMSRARMEFAHAMPTLKIIEHPVTQNDYRPNQKRFWRITASEYNKIIFRRATFVIAKFKTAILEPLSKNR